MKIENILVIGDSSTNDRPLALRKALSLVKNRTIAIHLLCVVYCESDEHTTLLGDDTRQTLKQSLLGKTQENVEAILQKECIDTPNVSHEVVWNKHLDDAVDTLCRQKDFDLIIKTGHRTESLLHVPSDFHLLRVLHIPAMILRTHGWASQPVVLATIDFVPHKPEHMEMNRKVLDSAKQIAQMSNAELRCCYVISCSKILIDMDIIDPRDLLLKFKQNYEAELFDFVAEYEIAPEQLHVKAGAPVKLIPSIANHVKADLVVMGTHHRKGVSGFVIGNICEKILSVLRTDVLTVKPE